MSFFKTNVKKFLFQHKVQLKATFCCWNFTNYDYIPFLVDWINNIDCMGSLPVHATLWKIIFILYRCCWENSYNFRQNGKANNEFQADSVKMGKSFVVAGKNPLTRASVAMKGARRGSVCVLDRAAWRT